VTAKERIQTASTVFKRLLHETAGQDLVEYALLTAAVGIAAVVAWNAMEQVIFAVYSSWDTSVQDLWEPQDPGS
jgi:Flp pilus assembly pilin Flp